jgi:cation diffusion facilitator family transporter
MTGTVAPAGAKEARWDAASTAARWMLVGNAGLCVVKLVVGAWGGSFPLLADGINNLTDVGSSLALLAGLRLARRPADDEHAYGHGRIEQEVARLVAVGVLVTGGLIAVEALRRLPVHHEAPPPLVLVVALAAIVVKLWMYRFQLARAAALDSRALRADAMNHKWDVASTLCVLAGAAAVAAGGPAWSHIDDLAALAVAALMVVTAARSIYAISSELLDRMPPAHIVEHVRDLADAFPRIRGVERVIGRRSGMGYFLDLHLEVDGDLPVREGHDLGHQVKDLLMAELPEIADIIVHIEPAPEAGGGAVDPAADAG